MIEVRRFQGSAEELSEFVEGVWERAYGGKMTFPVWPADYFRWQLRLENPELSSYLLAAYDNDQLAGVLLGIPQRFRLGEQFVNGSVWSWLSVHAEFRGQRIAVELDQARVQLMKEEQIGLITSYRFFGSRYSQAEKPQNRSAANKQFVRKLGLWARVLDPVGLQKWHVNRFEGMLGLASYGLTGIAQTGQKPAITVRPAEEADLAECLRLTRLMSEEMAFGIDWQAEDLRHHLLSSPISQTLVCEEHGRVGGFVNFHVLPFRGRIVKPVGVFDFIVTPGLSSVARRELVNNALKTMRDQGAIMAMKLNTGDVSTSTMLRTGWVPRRPDSYLIFQWVNQPMLVESTYPLHLLWR